MTMIRIALELPEEALLSAHIQKKYAAQEVKRLLALELFRERRISLGRAAGMAQMCVADFMDLAAQREIPIHYRREDLEADLKAAQGA